MPHSLEWNLTICCLLTSYAETSALGTLAAPHHLHRGTLIVYISAYSVEIIVSFSFDNVEWRDKRTQTTEVRYISSEKLLLSNEIHA